MQALWSIYRIRIPVWKILDPDLNYFTPEPQCRTVVSTLYSVRKLYTPPPLLRLRVKLKARRTRPPCTHARRKRGWRPSIYLDERGPPGHLVGLLGDPLLALHLPHLLPVTLHTQATPFLTYSTIRSYPNRYRYDFYKSGAIKESWIWIPKPPKFFGNLIGEKILSNKFLNLKQCRLLNAF